MHKVVLLMLILILSSKIISCLSFRVFSVVITWLVNMALIPIYGRSLQ